MHLNVYARSRSYFKYRCFWSFVQNNEIEVSARDGAENATLD